MSILYRPMKKWPEDVKIERLRAPFKMAASNLHPDVGGEPDKWEMLQAAKTLLDDYHNPK